MFFLSSLKKGLQGNDPDSGLINHFFIVLQAS